jgi:hypothetical protein
LHIGKLFLSALVILLCFYLPGGGNKCLAGNVVTIDSLQFGLIHQFEDEVEDFFIAFNHDCLVVHSVSQKSFKPHTNSPFSSLRITKLKLKAVPTRKPEAKKINYPGSFINCSESRVQYFHYESQPIFCHEVYSSHGIRPPPELI